MTTAVEASGVSARDNGSAILVAENVTMRFGGLVAVDWRSDVRAIGAGTVAAGLNVRCHQ